MKSSKKCPLFLRWCSLLKCSLSCRVCLSPPFLCQCFVSLQGCILGGVSFSFKPVNKQLCRHHKHNNFWDFLKGIHIADCPGHFILFNPGTITQLNLSSWGIAAGYSHSLWAVQVLGIWKELLCSCERCVDSGVCQSAIPYSAVATRSRSRARWSTALLDVRRHSNLIHPPDLLLPL